MKAPNFRYVRPASLDEALALLERHGEGAIPLAGGQSLMAGLNMRLSAPELLVDISDLDTLRGLTVVGEEVVLGAATRHAEIEHSPLIREWVPLLATAIRHVAHVAIRNRGTIGGSLAYADPAAELPACIVALGGTIVLTARQGSRKVAAADFFTDMLETALRPGELITEIRLPAARPETITGFAELSRRKGDYAVAGLAATGLVRHNRLDQARLVYFGCVERAKLATSVSRVVADHFLPIDDGQLDQAIDEDLSPADSPGWRGETKLALAKVLTRRVLGDMQRQAAPS